MSSKLRYLALAILISPVAGCWETLIAQEPGWTSRVLKLGDDREISEQTPILDRPYRPLHFYGNAVRRNHYRGNPWPLPRDILITTAFLAPSSREREIQLEQRLAGPLNSTTPAPEDEEQKEAAPEADAEQPELDPDAEANDLKEPTSPSKNSQASSGPPRTTGSSRRSPRGRN